MAPAPINTSLFLGVLWVIMATVSLVDAVTSEVKCDNSGAQELSLVAFGTSDNAVSCNSNANMADVDNKVKECLPTSSRYSCNGFIALWKTEPSCASNLEVECWIPKTPTPNGAGIQTATCRQVPLTGGKKFICDANEVIGALDLPTTSAYCCTLLGFTAPSPGATPVPPMTPPPVGATSEIKCDNRAARELSLAAFGTPDNGVACNTNAYMSDVDNKVKECLPLSSKYECNGFLALWKQEVSCASGLEVECWIPKAPVPNGAGIQPATCREVALIGGKKFVCDAQEVVGALNLVTTTAWCCTLLGSTPPATPAPPPTPAPTPAPPPPFTLSCPNGAPREVSLQAFGASTDSVACSPLAHMPQIRQTNTACVPFIGPTACNGFVAEIEGNSSCLLTGLQLTCIMPASMQQGGALGALDTTNCYNVSLVGDQFSCEEYDVIAAFDFPSKVVWCCPLYRLPGTPTLTSATKSIVGTPSPTVAATASRTLSGAKSPSETPSIASTTSQTLAPSATPSLTPAASTSRTQTAIASPSLTVAATSSPTASIVPTGSPTPSMAASPSSTVASTLSSSVTAPSTGSRTRTMVAATTSPTPTALATPSSTIAATASRTPSPAATPSLSPSRIPTPSQSPSSVATASSSVAPTVSPTQSRAVTASPSPSRPATASLTPSIAPTASPSPSMVATPSATTAATASLTPSAVPTVSPTPTAASSMSKSKSMAATPSLSFAATASSTPSAVATPSSSPTVVPTRSSSVAPTTSLTSSVAATPSQTTTAPATPSLSVAATASQTTSPAPTRSVTTSAPATASSIPTAAATQSSTGTPTVSPTPSDDRTVTFTPTAPPTASSTLAPTASPTVSNAATVSSSPSMIPTRSETLSPAVTPSLSATHTVSPTLSDTNAQTAAPSILPTSTLSRSPTAANAAPSQLAVGELLIRFPGSPGFLSSVGALPSTATLAADAMRLSQAHALLQLDGTEVTFVRWSACAGNTCTWDLGTAVCSAPSSDSVAIRVFGLQLRLHGNEPFLAADESNASFALCTTHNVSGSIHNIFLGIRVIVVRGTTVTPSATSTLTVAPPTTTSSTLAIIVTSPVTATAPTTAPPKTTGATTTTAAPPTTTQAPVQTTLAPLPTAAAGVEHHLTACSAPPAVFDNEPFELAFAGIGLTSADAVALIRADTDCSNASAAFFPVAAVSINGSAASATNAVAGNASFAVCYTLAGSNRTLRCPLTLHSSGPAPWRSPDTLARVAVAAAADAGVSSGRCTSVTPQSVLLHPQSDRTTFGSLARPYAAGERCLVVIDTQLAATVNDNTGFPVLAVQLDFALAASDAAARIFVASDASVAPVGGDPVAQLDGCPAAIDGYTLAFDRDPAVDTGAREVLLPRARVLVALCSAAEPAGGKSVAVAYERRRTFCPNDCRDPSGATRGSCSDAGQCVCDAPWLGPSCGTYGGCATGPDAPTLTGAGSGTVNHTAHAAPCGYLVAPDATRHDRRGPLGLGFQLRAATLASADCAQHYIAFVGGATSSATGVELRRLCRADLAALLQHGDSLAWLARHPASQQPVEGPVYVEVSAGPDDAVELAFTSVALSCPGTPNAAGYVATGPATTCGGRGSCVEVDYDASPRLLDSGRKCVCAYPYASAAAGSSCDTCAFGLDAATYPACDPPPQCLRNCSFHGTCRADGCRCDAARFGRDCAYEEVEIQLPGRLLLRSPIDDGYSGDALQVGGVDRQVATCQLPGQACVGTQRSRGRAYGGLVGERSSTTNATTAPVRRQAATGPETPSAASGGDHAFALNAVQIPGAAGDFLINDAIRGTQGDIAGGFTFTAWVQLHRHSNGFLYAIADDARTPEGRFPAVDAAVLEARDRHSRPHALDADTLRVYAAIVANGARRQIDVLFSRPAPDDGTRPTEVAVRHFRLDGDEHGLFDGSWRMLSVSFDKASMRGRVYVDGETNPISPGYMQCFPFFPEGVAARAGDNATSRFAPELATFDPDGVALIGYGLRGSLDEVRVYSGAVSQATLVDIGGDVLLGALRENRDALLAMTCIGSLASVIAAIARMVISSRKAKRQTSNRALDSTNKYEDLRSASNTEEEEPTEDVDDWLESHVVGAAELDSNTIAQDRGLACLRRALQLQIRNGTRPDQAGDTIDLDAAVADELQRATVPQEPEIDIDEIMRVDDISGDEDEEVLDLRRSEKTANADVDNLGNTYRSMISLNAVDVGVRSSSRRDSLSAIPRNNTNGDGVPDDECSQNLDVIDDSTPSRSFARKSPLTPMATEVTPPQIWGLGRQQEVAGDDMRNFSPNSPLEEAPMEVSFNLDASCMLTSPKSERGSQVRSPRQSSSRQSPAGSPLGTFRRSPHDRSFHKKSPKDTGLLIAESLRDGSFRAARLESSRGNSNSMSQSLTKHPSFAFKHQRPVPDDPSTWDVFLDPLVAPREDAARRLREWLLRRTRLDDQSAAEDPQRLARKDKLKARLVSGADALVTTHHGTVDFLCATSEWHASAEVAALRLELTLAFAAEDDTDAADTHNRRMLVLVAAVLSATHPGAAVTNPIVARAVDAFGLHKDAAADEHEPPQLSVVKRLHIAIAANLRDITQRVGLLRDFWQILALLLSAMTFPSRTSDTFGGPASAVSLAFDSQLGVHFAIPFYVCCSLSMLAFLVLVGLFANELRAGSGRLQQQLADQLDRQAARLDDGKQPSRKRSVAERLAQAMLLLFTTLYLPTTRVVLLGVFCHEDVLCLYDCYVDPEHKLIVAVGIVVGVCVTVLSPLILFGMTLRKQREFRAFIGRADDATASELWEQFLVVDISPFSSLYAPYRRRWGQAASVMLLVKAAYVVITLSTAADTTAQVVSATIVLTAMTLLSAVLEPYRYRMCNYLLVGLQAAILLVLSLHVAHRLNPDVLAAPIGLVHVVMLSVALAAHVPAMLLKVGKRRQ